jgi:hypothetical protein
MQILESWEDNEGRAYAVVEHSTFDQVRFKCRSFEAMFEFDGELQDFAGGPGHGIGDFDSAEDAQEFLMTGIARQDENPEIWLDMLELTPEGRRGFDADNSGKI